MPYPIWIVPVESLNNNLHNNHHAHPRATKFSMRRFELDPSWRVIRYLAAVALVEIVGAAVAPGWPPAAGQGRPD